MRRLIALCGVLTLAACGSVTATDNSESAVDAAPQASTRLQSVPTYEGQHDIANPGFVVGEQFMTGTGPYHRLRIDPSHHIFADIREKVTESFPADGDSIIEAASVAATFAAEELATSAIAFDYSSRHANQWWIDNMDRFDPAWTPVIKRQFLLAGDDSRALLYTNKGWARGTAILSSRVTDLYIKLTDLTVDEEGVHPSFTLTFNAPVGSLSDADGIFIERTVLSVTYDMVRPRDQWLIAGYETTWRSTYRVPENPQYSTYEDKLLARR